MQGVTIGSSMPPTVHSYGIPGATVTTEIYDDDFEEEEVVEEEGMDEASDPELDGTLKLARQQAEARSRAHAEAHQSRLLALAREHYNGPQPPTPQHAAATAGGGAAAGHGASAAPPPSGAQQAQPLSQPAPQPPPNLKSVRHAALQERCRQALGDLFPPVYSYLREARQNNCSEKEVRKELQALVGRDRLNDCLCVDELVYTEQYG